jgi:predicted DCC family thiol-disulfide oxidoreductase YuxK
MTSLKKLTLFYDGACPLCQAEILFLSRRNQAGLLNFVDVHSQQFHSDAVGISCEQALAAMYAKFENGHLIQGAAVFPEAYRRANLPVLAWIFSRKSLLPILNLAYRFFAKHRHAISACLGPTALYLVKRSTAKSRP